MLAALVLGLIGCKTTDPERSVQAGSDPAEEITMVEEKDEGTIGSEARDSTVDGGSPDDVPVSPVSPNEETLEMPDTGSPSDLGAPRSIEGGEPVKLPPGARVQGVRRLEPVALGEGIDHDAPTLTITQEGRVVIAFVSRSSTDTETIMIREAPSARAELGAGSAASTGERAWNPALASAPDGTVWMAWCGREDKERENDHRRWVYLRRVRPSLGEIAVVGGGNGRHCDPAIDVSLDGTVHVAWEAEDRIAWRAFDSTGEAVNRGLIVSEGPFDRRPAILAADGAVHIAWDRLSPKRGSHHGDPRYDVLMRVASTRVTEQGFRHELEPIVVIDSREGIQAAPSLARSPDGGVLIAYHSSDRHPLVKWWRLRKLDSDGRISELDLPDPAGEIMPEGEQQGAEFPALTALPGGGLALVSRPSQGAYLHVIGASEVSPPLDLTRRGWGARGARAKAAFAPDGTLLAVRRARHEAILERFIFDDGPSGPPPFRALEPGSGELPVGTMVPASTSRPVGPEILGEQHEGKRVVFGDVHMHSALSDGTGPGDEIYARAHARGLDFAVLTDHDYIVGSRMFPSKLSEIVWITEWFNRLEDFATLHGFEWTTPPLPRGYGHRNVYYRGLPILPQPGFRDGYPDTPSLHQAISGARAFSVAHHTAWTGTDWENLDPARQRHVEVVSVHGGFEREVMEEAPIEPRGEQLDGLAVRGLAAGHVFGFLGGSDSHGLLWHHGLGRRSNPWDQGLTAAVVPELSREAIFDAMHARSTHATSGAPMILLASVSGRAMGEEGRVDGSPIVRWSYRTSADPVYLMVIRDGEPVHREDLRARSGAGSWTDVDAGEGRHVYYLRLVQGRGQAGVDVAWSSPVFLDTRSE